jgi:hypothetical protein
MAAPTWMEILEIVSSRYKDMTGGQKKAMANVVLYQAPATKAKAKNLAGKAIRYIGGLSQTMYASNPSVATVAAAMVTAKGWASSDCLILAEIVTNLIAVYRDVVINGHIFDSSIILSVLNRFAYNMTRILRDLEWTRPWTNAIARECIEPGLLGTDPDNTNYTPETYPDTYVPQDQMG